MKFQAHRWWLRKRRLLDSTRLLFIDETAASTKMVRLMVKGAVDGPTFLRYVKQCLAPTLNHRDVVVLDNLPAHKVDGVRKAIEATGASLFYFPRTQQSSLKQIFSKLKSLRKTAEPTLEALSPGIILHGISKEECNDYTSALVLFNLTAKSKQQNRVELGSSRASATSRDTVCALLARLAGQRSSASYLLARATDPDLAPSMPLRKTALHIGGTTLIYAPQCGTKALCI